MTTMKGILIGILGFLAVASSPAFAERPTADLFPWLIRLGPIAFNKGGGAFLPASVLSGLRQGQVSPVLQFVMVNNLMAKCVKDTLNYTPDIRDPYVVAKAKFDYGLCRIKKCFQQGMLIMILPQLSSHSGDGQDQSGASQQGLILAQAFKKDPACDGQGGDGLDPMLLAALAK